MKASQQSLFVLHPVSTEEEVVDLAAMQLAEEEEELKPAKAAAQQAKKQQKEAEQELAKPGSQAHCSQSFRVPLLCCIWSQVPINHHQCAVSLSLVQHCK